MYGRESDGNRNIKFQLVLVIPLWFHLAVL